MGNRKKHKVWFDQNLTEKKKEVVYLSKQLQKYPNDTYIRGKFFSKLKEYNKERNIGKY